MKTLCLMVRKLCKEIKVFQMYVKGHGQNAKYESPMSYRNGQGHVLKIYGTIGKILS